MKKIIIYPFQNLTCRSGDAILVREINKRDYFILKWMKNHITGLSEMAMKTIQNKNYWNLIKEKSWNSFEEVEEIFKLRTKSRGASILDSHYIYKCL